MKAANRLATLSTAVVAGILLLSTAPLAQAQEASVPFASTNPSPVITTKALQVQAQMRPNQTIVDTTLQLAPPLTKGGKLEIALQDQAGHVLARIPFELAPAINQMSAWFDLNGYSAGTYAIHVTHTDALGHLTQQSQLFHYSGHEGSRQA
ncbi:hypothetical protein [Streptococcus halichoeri]|uniref:hypothetical protein n=1 Tax=Streptococcus halichoeri TaxID=254785 RepID=UPI001358C616|nr:hypothetical protein [Streptococcus halichoeri]